MQRNQVSWADGSREGTGVPTAEKGKETEQILKDKIPKMNKFPKDPSQETLLYPNDQSKWPEDDDMHLCEDNEENCV